MTNEGKDVLITALMALESEIKNYNRLQNLLQSLSSTDKENEIKYKTLWERCEERRLEAISKVKHKVQSVKIIYQ